MKRTLGTSIAVAGLTLLLASCGGQTTKGAEASGQAVKAANTVPPASQRLVVGLTEWAVAPDRRLVAAGAITIVAANEGQTLHDLVIVRSDLGPKELAVASSRGDESKMKIIGRFQEFKAGEKEKQFALDSGNYLLICNLPAHYEQGMVAQLRVE
ncbi:MAG: hypothetical protein ABIQ47_02360 [Tepidiformaceae bacterium]